MSANDIPSIVKLARQLALLERSRPQLYAACYSRRLRGLVHRLGGIRRRQVDLVSKHGDVHASGYQPSSDSLAVSTAIARLVARAGGSGGPSHDRLLMQLVTSLHQAFVGYHLQALDSEDGLVGRQLVQLSLAYEMRVAQLLSTSGLQQ